jgi:hypothetical protein
VTSPIERELGAELQRIQTREEFIPFLGQLLAVDEVEFRPLPDDMRLIIQSSPDYVSIVPGQQSTWLNVETDDDHAALVVYRAGDGSFHVLARRSQVEGPDG